MLLALPGLSPQRSLALIMVLLEALTIAGLSRTAVMPVLIGGLALIGASSLRRYELSRQRVYDITALTAMIYLGRYMLLDDNPRYTSLFASQKIALEIALFVLTLQALLFFQRRNGDRLPLAFPGMGVIALACAAIIEVNPRERLGFQLAAVIFAILSALYCDVSRHFISPARRHSAGRTTTITAVLLVTSLAGWVTASAMHRYEQQVDRLMRELLEKDYGGSGAVGFGDTSRLGSAALNLARSQPGTALRVLSVAPPGYLRGRVYDIYRNRRWTTSARGLIPAGQPEPPQGVQSGTHPGRWYQWQAKPPLANAVRMEVWPDSSLAGTCFAPLRCCLLHAPADQISISPHGVIRTDEDAGGEPYSLFVGPVSPVSSSPLIATGDEYLIDLLDVPQHLTNNLAVQQLTADLFRHCRSDTEKIRAVEQHFRDGFEYSLNVSVPGHVRDPLEWFLEARPAAHCEYFASAATILLRMGGVPSRYAVGFVVSEQNQFSGEWMARHRDAHAWAEAWVPDRGWITVEATPDAGVPAPTESGLWSQFSEYMSHQWERLRVEIRHQGLARLGSLLTQLLLTPAGIGLIAISGLWLAVRIGRGLRREKAAPLFVVPMERRSLHGALLSLDRVLAQFVAARASSETPDQFAARLESRTPVAAAIESHSDSPAVTGAIEAGTLAEAADWYREYARQLYSGTTSTSAIQSLVSRSATLQRQLRPERRTRHF